MLASRSDLVRAAQLRLDLAAEYAALKAEIGHQFRSDMSMADVIADGMSARRQWPELVRRAVIGLYQQI